MDAVKAGMNNFLRFNKVSLYRKYKCIEQPKTYLTKYLLRAPYLLQWPGWRPVGRCVCGPWLGHSLLAERLYSCDGAARPGLAPAPQPAAPRCRCPHTDISKYKLARNQKKICKGICWIRSKLIGSFFWKSSTASPVLLDPPETGWRLPDRISREFHKRSLLGSRTIGQETDRAGIAAGGKRRTSKDIESGGVLPTRAGFCVDVAQLCSEDMLGMGETPLCREDMLGLSLLSALPQQLP